MESKLEGYRLPNVVMSSTFWHDRTHCWGALHNTETYRFIVHFIVENFGPTLSAPVLLVWRVDVFNPVQYLTKLRYISNLQTIYAACRLHNVLRKERRAHQRFPNCEIHFRRHGTEDVACRVCTRGLDEHQHKRRRTDSADIHLQADQMTQELTQSTFFSTEARYRKMWHRMWSTETVQPIRLWTCRLKCNEVYSDHGLISNSCAGSMTRLLLTWTVLKLTPIIFSQYLDALLYCNASRLVLFTVLSTPSVHRIQGKFKRNKNIVNHQRTVLS